MTSLFETDGTIYMGSKSNPAKCNVALFGVPYDGTTSYRPGTRFGPVAIKDVSNGLETYDPQINLDLEEINFIDLGLINIPVGAPEPMIKSVRTATDTILRQGLKPLMLGGEHSISSGAVAAVAHKYPDLVLLQLDAHADLRTEWLGNKHSHACAMRRCLDVLPSKNLLQLAIRSGSREEFVELNHNKRLVPMLDIEKYLKPLRGKPLYVTVDLDWFDPAVMPGTGTPEPGGFIWVDFTLIVNELLNHKLVGADVVELAPLLDPTGCSSILASKVTRTLLLLLGRS
uniref:Agmatinase, putative n=1 Tax=Paulinella chromatophora TaxID=39717 RepID=B1X4F4_PAUCH|nr:agmatinase, putative [Paulinella chromatophora]ACB42823.1 agmatinase, putative [Paulinella chromatophora]